MPLSDIYEVKLYGSLQGEQTLNVFHVFRVNAGATSLLIRSGLHDTVVNPTLLSATSDRLTYNRYLTYNLGDVSDFEDLNMSTAGTVAEESLPAHDAVTIRFQRASRAFRHGYKRFAGIPISHTDEGNLAGGAVALLWSNVKNDLLANYESNSAPGVTQGYLVVVKRIWEPPTSQHQGYWRMPKTDGELQYYRPGSATVNSQITSQVSRKS